MVFYDFSLKKNIEKKKLPKEILEKFHNAFLSLDITKDLSLFDIKKLKGDYRHEYFRLRKGKFRAIFYLENDNFYVVHIDKRETVYGYKFY